MQLLVLHAVVRCKYCASLRLHVQDQYMLNLCLRYLTFYTHIHCITAATAAAACGSSLLRVMHSYCQQGKAYHVVFTLSPGTRPIYAVLLWHTPDLNILIRSSCQLHGAAAAAS
jgi:hypothetical protein